MNPVGATVSGEVAESVEVPRRADAVRNREKVIAAAEQVFAEHGIEAGVPEIAEKAGVGKGTVVLEDFDHAEAIFVIGQNTGTNSPRMMTNLVEARKRGIPIVAVNPMPERALIRFAEPQDIVQMATFGSTPISSEFVHIRIGGDLAFLKGIMKAMFEREAAGETVLDLGCGTGFLSTLLALHGAEGDATTW